jgi:hypothetical protein
MLRIVSTGLIISASCFSEALAQTHCNPGGKYDCPRCSIVPAGTDSYIIDNGCGHTTMIPLAASNQWAILPSSDGCCAAGILSTNDCKQLNINGVIWRWTSF